MKRPNRTESNETRDRPYKTVREVVALSGFSEHYIRDGIRAGRIPYVKCGKAFKIPYQLFMEQMEREARMNGGSEPRE